MKREEEVKMPVSRDFPYPRRYNSLRLLGVDYTSSRHLWFITLNVEHSRPVFGDIRLAKDILTALLSEQTSARIRVYAFTLMPDHFHLVAGIEKSEKSLSSSLGAFKSYTTQVYWKRAKEIVDSGEVSFPSTQVERNERERHQDLLAALIEWRAYLRPEVVELKKWPRVKPQHFLEKTLWQSSFYEHIIRNEIDLKETLEYIAFNPVQRGYVSRPQFYPFTGFFEG
jgi:REP element-mobilizing transposase RayT